MGGGMTDILIAAVGLLAGFALYLMMKKRKGRCPGGVCSGCPAAGNCAIIRSKKTD